MAFVVAGKSANNEVIQDGVAIALTDSASIDFTYDDGNNTITGTVIQAGVDHGSISGLADDDHSQYALLAGRATGQTFYGGTAAGDDLTLRGTSNATAGDVIVSASDLVIATAGKGLKIATGANATVGTATMVNGTVTVSTTAAKSNSLIFVMRNGLNASTSIGYMDVGSISDGVSFTINSMKQNTTLETGDQSTFYWLIINQA